MLVKRLNKPGSKPPFVRGRVGRVEPRQLGHRSGADQRVEPAAQAQRNPVRGRTGIALPVQDLRADPRRFIETVGQSEAQAGCESRAEPLTIGSLVAEGGAGQCRLVHLRP